VLATVSSPSFGQSGPMNIRCTHSLAFIYKDCLNTAREQGYNLNDPKTMAFLKKQCNELVRRCRRATGR
jgi:hypothetical protein